MRVAEAVGRVLAQLGVRQAFGVVGSGNFWLTDGLVAGGAQFVAARHENGAAMMADAFSRGTGQVVVLSLHQGCGLTNALTGITEAAKSRTPLLVVAGDTPPTATTSNFWIDQAGAAQALGVVVERIHSPHTAVADAARAYRRALHERRTVLLNVPLDVQEATLDWATQTVPTAPTLLAPGPSAEAVRQLAGLLATARRPVLLAGRGAADARDDIERLAEACAALLATSAVARGLFAGNPWSVDVMGGFATPTAAELIADADLIVAFGASLNRWTTRNGSLVRDATLVQVDLDLDAVGFHTRVDLGVLGDAAQVAQAVAAELERSGAPGTGYRGDDVAAKIQTGGRWRDVPYDDTSTADLIDPRTLTIALDDLLPAARVVVPDAGNFTGYPAMFLQVPDHRGFCLQLAFQSIGLGLPAAIGAACAAPERLAVAGLGDGGFLMSIADLDTAVRLGIPLVVVVYDDSAYGAEVHHFGPQGASLKTVEFPDTDIAALARGFGCTGVTVRTVADLEAVREWLSGPRATPLVIDAKITSFPSWVAEHTF